MGIKRLGKDQWEAFFNRVSTHLGKHAEILITGEDIGAQTINTFDSGCLCRGYPTIPRMMNSRSW